MQQTAHLLRKTDSCIGFQDLRRYAEGWILDCDIRQLSWRTIENRRLVIQKLLWFLQHKDYSECGLLELKQFLSYVSSGHEEANGRWGNSRLRRKVRPLTVSTYYSRLRTLFRYLVEEGAMDDSPLERITPPVSRPDQIQPFAEDQVTALLNAARRSAHPRRDEAIVLFLLDTGLRASELCALRKSDVDIEGHRCQVLGKGNKYRFAYFGKATAKALWQYIREDRREDDTPFFRSDRGTKATDGLTRSGLLQLIHRLGVTAGIQSARCSPHTFRHTFAVEFLRGGGNVFTLKELLGHTSLTICNRYVMLAQADLENQHRQFSPADRLRRRMRQ